MQILSPSVANSGFICHLNDPKLPFQNLNYDLGKFNSNSAKIASGKIPSFSILLCSSARRYGTSYAHSVGRDHHQPSFGDEFPQEPFILSLFKESFWAVRSMVAFLVEQPSQLKYIEWPGFRSTLKTATLTLVLVALLIVALSSVDAALSYLLSMLLRRTP